MFTQNKSNHRSRKLALRSIALVSFVVVLTSCAVPTTYRWGIYEDHVYADYATPGARSPQEAADMLEADIGITIDRGERVPPGVYAHLGYLYYLTGNTDTAVNLFEKEKAEFPESTVFIDTLLTNLGGSQ